MANRYTDTDKWRDDWFIDLTPKMKCVWNYLCDNVCGCGEQKLSWKMLSTSIGEHVSRAEFDAVFAGRVFWLTEDSIWIPGTLSRIYKTLSPKIPAHLNAAKRILSLTDGIALTQRGEKVRKRFSDFLSQIKPTSIPDQALIRACSGPDSKEKGEERKEYLGKEGVGEKPTAATAEPGSPLDPPPIPDPEPPPAKFDPIDLATAWNRRMERVKTAIGAPMPQVELTRLKTGQDRWEAAESAIREEPSAEWWAEVIDRVARSKFCRGHGTKHGWNADFDFLVKPETAILVMEGKYGCSPREPMVIPPSQANAPPAEEAAVDPASIAAAIDEAKKRWGVEIKPAAKEAG